MKAEEAADGMMFQRVAPIKKVGLECTQHLESTGGGEEERGGRGRAREGERERGGVMSEKRDWTD